MAVPCFYCPDIPEPGGVVVLSGDESRHATGSRRLGTGDPVALIDGRGTRARGNIEAISSHRASVTVATRERLLPPRPRIAVAGALPKGERLRLLLDMLAQLAVSQFIPLHCRRSAFRPRASSAARWKRILLEACKQSGNPWLPELTEPQTPGKAVTAWRSEGMRVLLAHPGAEAAAGAIGTVDAYGVLIGPEGGFTDEEVDSMIQHGASPIDLGSSILRIETAAVALVSAVRLHDGTFR